MSFSPSNPTGMPFDDFRALVPQLPEPDEQALEIVRGRNEVLRKPVGSLGQLEDLCEWLATWSGKSPQVLRPLVAVFAGTHELARRLDGEAGEHATLADVTNATAGGAPVNQACATQDVGLKIFDLALQYPVADITKSDALDERGCAATIAFGMEAVAGGTDLIAISDMAYGNSVSASAMLAALWGGEGKDWVLDEADDTESSLARKREMVHEALEFHKGKLDDPFEVLRRLGGREFAAIVGAILAARVQRIPVVLDGFAALASASMLARLDSTSVMHCRIAGKGSSNAEREAARYLGLPIIHDLGIGISDGTAAAIAVGIIKTAAQIHSDMAIRED